MKKLIYFSLGVVLTLSSCSKNDDISKWITPPSTGSTMTLNGGPGEGNAQNSVYVSLSSNKQESIKRHSWHLAFNCGSEFGVFLNSTAVSRATEGTGVEINSIISEAQLEPFAKKLEMTMGESSTMDIVYKFDKSISGTVIKEGKTYIYRNEDNNLPHYKIKVVKKDNNAYTVSYAVWNSSDVKTVEIKKDAKQNIVGFSLTDGSISVVETENWDFVWGRNTYESAMMPGAPSAMADIVFINNKGGVKAAQIMEEDIAYDNFSAGNIDVKSLSSDIGVIGGNWRGTGGMPPVMAVNADRYYIIQDISGNIYKLKFLAIGGKDDGATRGYPQLKFDLVREAQ